MTEDEAKPLICWRTIGSPGGTGPCLGSACMAWRWMPRTFDYRRGPLDIVVAREKPQQPDNPHQYWQVENVMEETWGRFGDVGYCGPAGKP